MKISQEKLGAIARAELDATVAALPPALRAHVESIPISFQSRPSAIQQRDGIEPDTLGLFGGADLVFERDNASPLPPQIILFLENIWEESEADDEIFRTEVRTTFLHELGHYLGLNEDDLFERGLE
ncbi:MAG: metallopeptidase family protein [Verrucomicrobiota bacterium]